MILIRISIPDLQKSTYVQTDRQTDGNFFLCLFYLLRHTKHEHSSKGENFFFTHAITILSLCTYSVCDQKVKTTPCYGRFTVWQRSLELERRNFVVSKFILI